MQSGVVLILISMSLTPFGDALSKYLGLSQSPMSIVFLRYFVAGLIALMLARLSRSPVRVERQELPGLVVRTALVVSAMTCLIAALSMVPLANAVGGFLIAPIVAMIISVVVLKQALTLPKLVGSIISFIGAMVILRPSGEIESGMILALLGGCLLGAFLALCHNAPQKGSPISALAVQCLLGSLMLAPFALGNLGNLNWAHLPAVIGLGAVTAATHFLTVSAYQKASAVTLAPFFYFNLIAAVIVGLIWFGEVPVGPAVLGLGAILVGGLFSLIPSNTIQTGRRRFFATIIANHSWQLSNSRRMAERIGDTAAYLWCTRPAPQIRK